MRLVIARCSVDYIGRLTAHLPLATRLLLVKADGSVLVHADGGSYKPLNWMSPPCTLVVDVDGESPTWTVTNKAGEQLIITIEAVEHDSAHELGVDPGLVKDGVEAHLQKLLAEHIPGARGAASVHIAAFDVGDVRRLEARCAFLTRPCPLDARPPLTRSASRRVRRSERMVVLRRRRHDAAMPES